MRARVRRCLVRALTLLACGVANQALAQPVVAAEPETSPLRCLVGPSAKRPSYPEGMAEQKTGGVFRVRLTFDRADEKPQVEWTYVSAGEPFQRAVLDWIAQYRLPCLDAAAGPVIAVQEFQFVPGDGRKVIDGKLRGSGPLIPPCLVGAETLLDSPGESGTVVASATFVGPSGPPRVEINFQSGPRLGRAVRQHMEAWRMPCLTRTLTLQQTYNFRYEGERRSRFGDTTLQTFLASVLGIEKQHVRFDFSTMSCPFEVQFVFFQPFLPNGVGEIERTDPNRREFLEWLKGVELDLKPSLRKQMIGETMTISVPCGVVDLL